MTSVSRICPIVALTGWLLAATATATETPAPPASAAPQASESPAATPPDPPPPRVAEEPPAALPARIDPEPLVLLPRVGDYHRAALQTDPVEAAVARGEWKTPVAGDNILDAAGNEATWRADAGERSAGFAGGYSYAEFESPAAGVMLLEAPGAAAVCLNGEWVPGDPYGVGWFRLPVEVQSGKNTLLTHLAAPSARPWLVRPAGPVAWVPAAATLPDLVVDAAEPVVLSAPLLNAGTAPLVGCRLRVRWGDEEPTTTPLRRIDSLLLTPITITTPTPPPGLAAGATALLRVEVLPAEPEGATLAEATLTIKVVTAEERRTDTFVSEIDGSVQPYGVLPATGDHASAGVLVSLHDAGQNYMECLAKHRPTEGVHIITPGGRGRWGFDGEDWSRTDTLEALDDFERRQAERKQPTNKSRVAVLGEGMGGHAALRLATLRPDRIVAAGVVDGWLSFYTQGGALVTPTDASPIAQLLGRQASSNDPLRVLENLQGVGVSLLHAGRADVAPTEARFLRERLGEFHNDFAYREADGAEGVLGGQVAWLMSRRLSDFNKADTIDFTTPDVGVSSTLGWVTIVALDRQGEIARVRLTRDLERREIVGVTNNIRRLNLALDALRDRDVVVRLDGGRRLKFRPGRDAEVLSLARDEEGEWRRVPDTSALAGVLKGAARPGGFKSVFCCRPQLVYGTRGSDVEQRWMAAKTRYDAHLFLYRGAGLLEVLPDTELRTTLRTRRDAERSVVVYGSPTTNTGWTVVQQEAFYHRSRTVRLERSRAWLGERPESGDDLALLAVRPRAGSDVASIGIVGGTGITGMRMTTRLRYFWSGVAYPDYLLFGPTAIDSPNDVAGARDVRAAGYFGADWGVEGRGVLWRDLAL